MKADLARATRMSESLVEPTEKEAECGDVEKAGRALVEGVEEPSGHLLPKADIQLPTPKQARGHHRVLQCGRGAEGSVSE